MKKLGRKEGRKGGEEGGVIEEFIGAGTLLILFLNLVTILGEKLIFIGHVSVTPLRCHTSKQHRDL